MENHPIPQDVTGFQFKLIGDMTIKQFAYLATGVVCAWIAWSLPMPFLIKAPFIIGFAGFGAGLAFLPVAGRPFDLMISYFLKALTHPNLFVYARSQQDLFPQVIHTPKKAPAKAKQHAGKDKKELQSFLQSLSTKHQTTGKADEREKVFFQSLSGVLQNLPQQANVPLPQPVQPLPPPAEEKEAPEKEEAKVDTTTLERELDKEEALLKQELAAAKQEEVSKPQGIPADVHQRVVDLEGQMQKVLQEKAELQKQIFTLQQRLLSQQKQTFAPMPPLSTSRVKSIPKNMAIASGAPLVADVPNLIAGIVKDPRGNALPNILIEVKDKENNPVRAFKTNQLGQFVAATPLMNGDYTVELEDPKGENKFDAIALVIKGEIVSPLEVTSHDSREELRRALFN